jgi:hypothetical protein
LLNSRLESELVGFAHRLLIHTQLFCLTGMKSAGHKGHSSPA